MLSQTKSYMPEHNHKLPTAPEGSSDEAVAAIEALGRAADEAETAVRTLLVQDAAERIADKTEPGDA